MSDQNGSSNTVNIDPVNMMGPKVMELVAQVTSTLEAITLAKQADEVRNTEAMSALSADPKGKKVLADIEKAQAWVTACIEAWLSENAPRVDVATLRQTAKDQRDQLVSFVSACRTMGIEVSDDIIPGLPGKGSSSGTGARTGKRVFTLDGKELSPDTYSSVSTVAWHHGSKFFPNAPLNNGDGKRMSAETFSSEAKNVGVDTGASEFTLTANGHTLTSKASFADDSLLAQATGSPA